MLRKTGKKPPGQMPLSKAGEANRLPVLHLQIAHPHGSAGIVLMSSACITQLTGRPIMTGHAIIDPKSPGKERGTTGKAGRIRGMALTKKDALARQIINHRRSWALIPIASQMIGTTRVNIKIEDTHLRFLHFFLAFSLIQRNSICTSESKYSRRGAAFPDNESSIPSIRAAFLCFTSKSALGHFRW